MHLHKWSRWEVDTAVLTTTTLFGSREEKVRRAIQKRVCLKCNFTKIRYLHP